MIGLDTNVVVRYLTLDDPVQVPAAETLMDSLSAEEPGFISLVVVAELAWVLDGSYNFNKASIVRAFEALLQSKEIVIEQTELVSQALRLFAAGNAGLADYLIERSGHTAGCSHTFTFDKRAAASAGMRLLK
jgi:predicted nucleic-acid-binding protein